MLKNLIKIAADLDSAGFKMEADIVDVIIRRVASELEEPEEGDQRGIPTVDISDEDLASLFSSLEGLEEEIDPASYEEWDAREREAGRR
jgi:hypothetical protein